MTHCVSYNIWIRMYLKEAFIVFKSRLQFDTTIASSLVLQNRSTSRSSLWNAMRWSEKVLAVTHFLVSCDDQNFIGSNTTLCHKIVLCLFGQLFEAVEKIRREELSWHLFLHENNPNECTRANVNEKAYK